MEKFPGIVRLEFNYSKVLGPRSEAAGVSLALSTHDKYEFINAAYWPEEDYSKVVERGVKEGLREIGIEPDLGIRVKLTSVEYDRVNSSEHAFRMAAKCAVKARAELSSASTPVSKPRNLDKIKPRVRELKAYTLSPDRASVKINQNENPWDLPEAVKRETLRRMSERAWSRYPDFIPVSLHEKLAAFSGWRADGVVAGNGSNELIQATLMVTVGEGRRVLISEPTFALYRQVTTILGGEVLSVPLNEELQFDVVALREAIGRHEPDVTILCSPNNPTGCRIEHEDLERLLEATRGIVVVDEAYFDFSGQSVAPLLSRHANLAVFRTFSKALAMAALRVGYLLTAPELAREVGKAVLPYNLNAFSQTAAEVAVEMYETELAPTVRRITAERDRLYEGLKSINGLAPVRSHANFMVVRSLIEPKRVFRELLARDILVRDVSRYPMLSDYFRVSVGTPEENNKLLAALGEIFSEEGGK
jgi:histidinol-phosphate aminotransferase